MKTIYISLLMLCLALSSCEKYLDIKRSSGQRFLETADDCQMLLDNPGYMNSGFPSDGEASADNYYLGSNRFPLNVDVESQGIYTWLPSAVRASAATQWMKTYNTVYNCNLVLEALEKNKESTPATTWNNLRGSALFYRAFAFWSIAQLYCKPYTEGTAATDPGIPVRTSSDINDASARGTVKETYARITQDLQEAAKLLVETSSYITRPTKTSAYAMLARVYLSMEDYPQALANANASLQLKSDLLDYNTTDVNAELLFLATLNADASPITVLLNPGSAGNPVARISPDLYNLYDANDIRKTRFFAQNSGAYAGTYRFIGSYDNFTGPNTFCGVAVDEMYLTRAECYARTGNLTLAMKDLNDLLKKRWKTGTYTDQSAATETAALNIILTERRKELVYRGLRWTDLRRLNKDDRFRTDITRKMDGTGPVIATLPANDARYTLLIPLEVINRTGLQQNLR